MSDIGPTIAPVEAREELSDRASHLSYVAHEVRNPLATALWSAELLTRLSAADRAGARGEKLARMCLRAIGRVRRLVEDHLLAERLDVDGIPIAFEPVAVDALLPREAAAIGAADLALDVEPGLAVDTDATLARRAVEALLCAAAEGGAAVRLTARRSGPAVRIQVEGAPATPSDLADRQRGDAKDVGGSALGLGVARRAAAALGGTLSVDRGALVLELPAIDPAHGEL
ncbi:MAG TPA: histidine kinase dimerization/phospho-acceptor domain-containing protein [Anaeromyxobacteraceae bacterium]|nr:histidine kinase dimerization/phospho-acceptor domain-containing protein [Anaeromyxobacteraceae bacterium]